MPLTKCKHFDKCAISVQQEAAVFTLFHYRIQKDITNNYLCKQTTLDQTAWKDYTITHKSFYHMNGIFGGILKKFKNRFTAKLAWKLCVYR